MLERFAPRPSNDSESRRRREIPQRGKLAAGVAAAVEPLERRALLSAGLRADGVAWFYSPAAGGTALAPNASADATATAAPGIPDLVDASDSGFSSTDNITNRNNATPGKTLQFLVPGTTAGATVTVYADGVAVGSATAAGSVTTVTTNGTAAIPDGVRAVTARQTVSGSSQSVDSAALSVTVRTATPATPAPLDLIPTSDSGVSNTDNLTNVSTPVFSVSVSPSPYYRVYLGGQLVGNSYATAPNFGPPSALPNGTYQFTVGAVDAAGNESAQSDPLAVTVDAAAPVAAAVAADVATPGGAAYSFAVRYSDFSGIDVAGLGAGDIVVTGPNGFSQAATFVSVDTNSVGTPRTAAYRITPPGGYWDDADNGTYTVSVAVQQVRDAAGNFVPAAAAGTFAVAAAGPGAPDLSAESDTGASDADDLTKLNNASPAAAMKFLVVNTHPGDTVALYADGVLVGTAAATGVTTTVTTDGATTLSDGTHAFRARLTPAGGTAGGDSAPLVVKVDTAVAATPRPALVPAADAGVSSSDGVTNVANPAFNVFAGEAGTIHLATDGYTDAFPVAAAGVYPVALTPASASFRATPANVPVGPGPARVHAADFNGDGKADLVTANDSTGFVVTLGNGDGTFQPSATTAVPDFSRLAVGDENGDGRADLIVMQGLNLSSVLVYTNRGDGTFLPPRTVPVSGRAFDVAVADMNKDGKPDLVAGNTGGQDFASVDVLTGNGDGTYRPAARYRTQVLAPFDVAVADLNGDGNPDVVDSEEGKVVVYLGNGDGTLRFQSVTGNTDRGGRAAVADLNTDGKPDLVTADNSPPRSFGFTTLIGNGDGSFRGPVTTFLPAYGDAYGFAVEDFDRDGKPDVIETYSANNGRDAVLALARGAGDGTFKPVQNLPLAGFVPTGLATGDFNRDGRLDLAAVSNGGSAAAVYFGAGGALTAGTYNVSAWFEDLAGNRSPDSPAATVTIDQTPPTFAPLAPGGAVTAAGATPYDFIVTYTGQDLDTTSLDGGDVLVTGPNGFSQQAALVSIKALPNGAGWAAVYRVTPPGGSWDPGDNGTYTVAVRPGQVKDVAGNAAAGGTVGTFDARLVGVTNIPDLLAATDSGASTIDNLTNFNNSSPARALQFGVGNTTPGATVTVYADGAAVGSAVAAGTTTTVTTDGATALTDGTHSFTVRQTLAGSPAVTTSAAQAVTIDTTAPAAPAAPDLQTSSDSGVSPFDNLTNVKTPTLTVAGSPYTRVYRDSVQFTAADLSGTTYTSPALADGTYAFAASSVDAAGNESPVSASLSVKVDTVSPTAGGLVVPTPQVGGATSFQFDVRFADDTALNVDTLTYAAVIVTGPKGVTLWGYGSTIDDYTNGTPRTATFYFVPPGGAWDITDNGTYTVSLAAGVARDTAGNAAAAATVGTFDVALNYLNPVGTPDLQPATDSGISATDNITYFNNATPDRAMTFTVLGTRAGAKVTLYADGVAVGSADATTTAATVTTDGSTVIPDGTHLVTARQMLNGFTTADSPALSVVVDTLALTPSVPDLDAASDSGVSNTDNLTNAAAPVFNVVAAEAGIIHLTPPQTTGTSPTAGTATGGLVSIVFPVPFPVYLPPQAVATPAPVVPDRVAAGDFNGDGATDLLEIVSASGQAAVALGKGDGTFNNQANLTGVTLSPDTAVADLNGDRQADLVTLAGGHIGILLGNGDGTFQPIRVYVVRSGSEPEPVVFGFRVADLNGDQKPDVVATTTASNVVLYVGVGDGTVLPSRLLLGETGYAGLSTLDFNNDGLTDVVRTNKTSSYATIAVQLNQGGGSFTTPREITFLGSVSVRAVGDLTGDGLTDVLASNASGSGSVLAIGDGSGLRYGTLLLPALDNYDLTTVADTDSDGKPDLIATSRSRPGQISVSRGNGDGTFRAPQTYAAGSDAGQFLTADLNNDGSQDVVTVNKTGATLSVLLNTAGPLAEGTQAISAWEEDVAGNRSANSAPLMVTIDQTAPDAPPAPDLTAASDAGASDADDVTNVQTPTLEVAGGPYYRLFDGTTQVSGDYATGSYASPALGDGTHPYTGRLVDAAGNVSDPSPTLSVKIDTVAPVVRISPITLNPQTGRVDSITLTFNEQMTTVDRAGLSLSRDGGANLLTPLQALDYFNGIIWTLTNVAAVTATPGTYTFVFVPTPGVTDAAGNAPAGAAVRFVVPPPPLPAGAAASAGAAYTYADGTLTLTRGTITFTQPVSADLNLIANGPDSRFVFA